MIIIAQQTGQLGNRLVLFAHLIAFAQEHHLTVINLAFEEYAPLFPSTRDDLLCRYPPAPFPLKPTPMRRRLLFRLAARVLREGKSKRLPFVHVRHLDDDQRFELNADFAEIARQNIVLIGGYFFRMPGRFPESADTLRAYFQPMPAVQRSVQQLIQTARAGHDVLIGVHLRQGDYWEYEDGRYFYTTAQYAALMSKVAALFAPRRAAFLVCSNEPQKAEAFAVPITFGTGDLAEDLYGLAACDYLIGPPSTFTVWASFYGSVPLCRVFDLNIEPRLEDFQLAQDQGWLY